MADVKWIKIVTDVFDDEKILMIETMPECDTIIVIWFKLLCLAGKQNNGGVFQMGQIPYTDEMFAAIFRRPINTVRLALNTFERFGMIEIIRDTVTIPNWGKHQSLDAYEKKKIRDRERIARKRAEQKALIGMSPDKSPDVASLEEDKDKEKEEDKDNKGNTNRQRFIPPTLEEVTAYVEQRKSRVVPQAFIDFYEAKGWMVGKNKMKDWKAACRNAEGWDRWNKTQNRVGANGIPLSNTKSDLEGVF